MYGLNYSIKSFAVANEFSATLNKICFKLGKTLKPFCLLANVVQEEHGVIDLMSFGGMIDGSITLLDDIIKYRQDEFHISPVPLSELTFDMKRTLLYDFLMSTSLCYVEVAGTKTVNGIEVPSYDKFLCTRNPAIMGAWMGLSPDEMQAKYTRRIAFDGAEFKKDILRYVRLNSSAKGNTISCPRKFAETTNMRCIPLFMIYAWISGLHKVMLDNVVKFSFVKDNGSIREFHSTLSESIIREFYSSNEFVSKMLSSIDIDTNQQGGMYLPAQISRGYMRIPELGSSMYDATGVRAVNISRILDVSVADIGDVDTSYINVSLDTVKSTFMKHLDRISIETPDQLLGVYQALTGESNVADKASGNMAIRVAIETYVENNDMLFSTSFKRDLHDFMKKNPSWFTGYTGMPVYMDTKPTGCGVADYEF